MEKQNYTFLETKPKAQDQGKASSNGNRPTGTCPAFCPEGKCGAETAEGLAGLNSLPPTTAASAVGQWVVSVSLEKTELQLAQRSLL